MSKVEDICGRFQELTDEELSQVAKLLCAIGRARHQEKVRLAAAQIAKGQLVVSCGEQMRSRVPVGTVGQVVLKKKVRIAVDFGPYGKWNIPVQFVKPAPEGAVMPVERHTQGITALLEDIAAAGDR